MKTGRLMLRVYEYVRDNPGRSKTAAAMGAMENSGIRNAQRSVERTIAMGFIRTVESGNVAFRLYPVPVGEWSRKSLESMVACYTREELAVPEDLAAEYDRTHRAKVA